MIVNPESIIEIKSDKIIINMNMTMNDFAKSRLLQYMTKQGLIATKNNDDWTFEEYTFTDTFTNDEKISISGSGFIGKSFYEILKSNDTEYKYKVFNDINNVYETAIERKIEIPNSGPFFTICNEDSILFLPTENAERALLNISDEVFSEYFGCWIHQGLQYIDSIRFTLSCYVYYLITNEKPFQNTTTTLRHEDYYDKNFIPLELTANCINFDLGKSITENLSLKNLSSSRNSESKKIPDIHNFFKPSINNFSNDEKKLMLEKRNVKQDKILKVVRFSRKNSFQLKTFGFVFLAIIVLILGFFVGRTTPPSTMGLTSEQVIETAYTGINILDVQLFNCCMKGSTGSNFEEIIANYYTTGKMRTMYEMDSGILSPGQWFHLKNDTAYGMFGLSNLEITTSDGTTINGNIFSKAHKHPKKEKILPLKEENNKQLKKGDTVEYSVTYYMIHNETIDKIFVEFHTDKLTLLYNGKQWLVNNIESIYEPIDVSTYSFNKEFNQLLAQSSNVYDVINKLHKTYEWLPTNIELVNGETELRKYFTDKYRVKAEE